MVMAILGDGDPRFGRDTEGMMFGDSRNMLIVAYRRPWRGALHGMSVYNSMYPTCPVQDADQATQPCSHGHVIKKAHPEHNNSRNIC